MRNSSAQFNSVAGEDCTVARSDGPCCKNQHRSRICAPYLGSGLIDQSQKITAAAIQIADMKVWAQRS